MARIRLPPDPDTDVVTTIVDSRQQDCGMASGSGDGGGDGGDDDDVVVVSRSILAGLECVDSIVLIYDLSRPETFQRLESHWLPLIERCYGGELPVILAANKMDLVPLPGAAPSSSSVAGTAAASAAAFAEEQTRSRKRVVSLMQRFRFVRQRVTCSARQLERVDDVFVRAQAAVLFPIAPLYDLNEGQITEKCRRAFTRIFRLFDRDRDGLLSHAELDAFQRQTFRVPLGDRELAGWKVVVSKNNPNPRMAVLRDGKFTVAGFAAIFDNFICQNRLDVPWRVLRQYGYDNDLNLDIPPSIKSPNNNNNISSYSYSAVSSSSRRTKGNITRPSPWKLSSSARLFLAALFRQFDADKDGMLSSDDLAEIFSVLPDPCLPPWHPARSSALFDGCHSVPRESLCYAPTASTASPPVLPTASSTPSSPMTTTTSPSPPPPQSDTAAAAGGSAPYVLSQSLSASGITIISGASLPTVSDDEFNAPFRATASADRPLSFLDWMNRWHVISSIAPATVRAELFRLGHADPTTPSFSRSSAKSRSRRRSGRRKTVNVSSSAAAARTDDGYLKLVLQSREIRVVVVGSADSRKSELIRALCGGGDDDDDFNGGGDDDDDEAGDLLVYPTTTEIFSRPTTSGTYCKMQKKQKEKTTTKVAAGQDEAAENFVVVNIILTEIPASPEQTNLLEAMIGPKTPTKDRAFDLVVFAFDAESQKSLSYAIELEGSLLSDDVPRVYAGTTTTTKAKEEGVHMEEASLSSSPAWEAGKEHCKQLDLEEPLLIPCASGKGHFDRQYCLDHLVRCAMEDEDDDNSSNNYKNKGETVALACSRKKSKPLEEQKRQDAAARRRKMMWLGGIVSVAVAVGVGVLWGGMSKAATISGTEQRAQAGGRLSGWLSSLFSFGGNSSSNGKNNTTAPVSR